MALVTATEPISRPNSIGRMIFVAKALVMAASNRRVAAAHRCKIYQQGVVLSRDFRSSEKFMHGIKVLMAKNYIDNLSEEARKGQLEKAAQGYWPTRAPMGYINVTGSDGKKTIEPDPEVFPITAKLFRWYATGEHSLKEVTRMARAEGLVYRKSGNKVPVSTVHSILRNRIYTGQFDWNGQEVSRQTRAAVSHRPMGTGSGRHGWP